MFFFSYFKTLRIAVITDANGKYAIDCSSDGTLIFSFIGYRTMERIAGDVNKVTITMEEETTEMEEVVVVAFGKQKKESVVSSITTVNPKELKVPSSNMTTAFAGRLAGVIAYQRSGEPGLDNAEFFIRGITTFSAGGKKDPLILIDGIEMNSNDLARLNPDDIASFSVMKDASSAALYGARGANGVILVTTKEGVADQVSVNIRVEASTSTNSELVELADPITYMQLHNEAVRTRDPMIKLPYSSVKIRNTQLGTDPVMYPSVNWYNYLIKEKTFNQRINTNITGGGKAVQYYIAANLQHDTGILKENEDNKFNNNIDIMRFQLRSNVTIKLTPQTKAMVRFYGTFDDSHGPRQGGAEAFNITRNATPVQFLPYYPKDQSNEYTDHILYGMAENENAYVNPLAVLVSGYKESKSSMMLAQMELEHTFDKGLKGLFLKGIFNIKRNSYYDYQRSYTPFYYAPATTTDGSYSLICFNPDTGTEYLTYNFGGKTVASYVYAEARAGYSKVFAEKHDLNLLLVASLRNETNTEVITIQESLPQRNISTAGRLAYGYDSRYFIEGNFGYNGSERFSKNNRWGFFPSIGVGWMLSNEAFMERIKTILTKLKLKATYGLVGNDQIGYLRDRFFYLSQVNMNNTNRSYTFGTDKKYNRTGISIDRYANEQITWEIAKKLNLGIELTLLNDFEVLADYFTEIRENILQTRTDIPATMGLVTIPQANVGVAKGYGVESEVRYQKNFNSNLFLVVNGNFTYASSKYEVYEEPDYSDVPWKTHIGQKLSQPYGYIAERLFIDESEVSNSPRQMFGAYGAGDIKYKDINDDGQIDVNDIVPIGHPTTPEVIYGAGFTLGAYGFDLSCFFQGSARSSFFISPGAITPFVNNGQRALLSYIANDHWSENNRNLYAFWPKLSDHAIDNNNQTSTHWLCNGAFVRLKTAEFGYTIPEKISQKMRIGIARIYISGSNLYLWSKFKMWDPEMAGNGLGYPIQRVFNLGLNVKF
ncbi:MAG: TonB-dependent receptor [Dysgonamonadaceae bacterium]|jgi:TonB-linked SusC/RagA family outer membrane protein|nr:TonB-dependent receptor [Dysgonamonadaceae bacterium]